MTGFPVREPYGPPGRIARRRPYHLGYQSAGFCELECIDLYTPQDCFGFSDPFGGRIEYNEKKPEVVVAAKPDPVELGHRASVAAGSTAGDRARGAGIRQ